MNQELGIKWFEKRISYHRYRFINTVKPEHSGHPWDPKKLAVVNRWPLFGGSQKNAISNVWYCQLRWCQNIVEAA